MAESQEGMTAEEAEALRQFSFEAREYLRSHGFPNWMTSVGLTYQGVEFFVARSATAAQISIAYLRKKTGVDKLLEERD